MGESLNGSELAIAESCERGNSGLGAEDVGEVCGSGDGCVCLGQDRVVIIV